MRLFTAAYHRGLSCDAYLIDSDRAALPLALGAGTPETQVIDALLARIVLMSRSLHDVRRRTFGLFRREGGFALAYPCYASIVSSLEETLQEFGPVRRGPDGRLRDFTPLLAFVQGRVSFFRGPETRAWERLAARRGLPIVAPVWSHEEADVLVDGVPMKDYAPAEATLDLDAPDELGA
jgi:hypothetical protein